jgi:hypothetical protein
MRSNDDIEKLLQYFTVFSVTGKKLVAALDMTTVAGVTDAGRMTSLSSIHRRSEFETTRT